LVAGGSVHWHLSILCGEVLAKGGQSSGVRCRFVRCVVRWRIENVGCG